MVNAFLTGSRIYGEFTTNSDIDIVVLIDKAQAQLLETLLGHDLVNYDHTCISVRSGHLNLLLCTEQSVFEAWKRGTDVLEAIAPVSRDEACKAMAILRGWVSEELKVGTLPGLTPVTQTR